MAQSTWQLYLAEARGICACVDTTALGQKMGQVGAG